MVNDFVRGIACICGGFLIHFSLGTIYTFGNMSPYVASYLRLRTSNDWVTTGHMVWIFSMAVFSQGLTMALGGIIERKIGTRLTCLIGCWTMSISTILTFFAIQKNIFTVIVTYGLLFGMGTGLTYSVALAAPMKWFPLRKGLVAGMVVAGYGLGSLLFNIVQTRYINPKNISPNSSNSEDKYFYDKDVLDKVPMCFVIIGCSYAIIQLLGVILLMNHDARHDSGEEQNLVEDSKDDDELYSSGKGYSTTNIQVIENAIPDCTVKEAIKTRQFWILWGTFFFNGIVIVTISSLYKVFGQQFIEGDHFFSIVGAVAAIFNCGGRLVWGRLLDRFSYRTMMSTLTMLMTIMMGTFYLCSMVPSTTGVRYMYFVWVCLLFFCLAGSFAMFPTATVQTFGHKNMAIIYGMVFAGYAMSSILGAIICSMLLKVIHYRGQFAVATVSAILSLCLTQFFGPLRTIQSIMKEETD